jgi:hypothetical protein
MWRHAQSPLTAKTGVRAPLGIANNFNELVGGRIEHKVGVVGSNPTARSRFVLRCSYLAAPPQRRLPLVLPGEAWGKQPDFHWSKGRRFAAPQACAWASRTGSSSQAAGGHSSTKIELHRPLPAPKKGRSLPKWVVPFGAL